LKEFSFRIDELRPDGTKNRRYHKVRYTAALRLGVIPTVDKSSIRLSFKGDPATTVVAHAGNLAYVGSLRLNDRSFDDIVVIVKRRDDGKVDLVSFWPRSQHPDAHKSYTDPLVDTAMDGTPFDIQIVASRMHEAFQANAGSSPATLMKILYDEETETLRQGGRRLVALLDESMERERQAAVVAERLGETNLDLSVRVGELEAEVERFKAEQNEARRGRQHATLSEPDRLIAVKERMPHRGSSCTILEMADGKQWYMKTSTFDPNGEVTKRAQSLVGQRIRISSWDPVGQPGKWSGQGYFRNVYATA
jgi:uncharacterized small protein (DUF1192 family)